MSTSAFAAPTVSTTAKPHRRGGPPVADDGQERRSHAVAAGYASRSYGPLAGEGLGGGGACVPAPRSHRPNGPVRPAGHVPRPSKRAGWTKPPWGERRVPQCLGN